MKGIVGDLSRTLDKYDERANELINGHAKSVFVSQYNYGVREVKDALGNKVDTSALSFSLVDEHTVNRLVKEDIKLLPKIDDDGKSKKKRKKWNEQKLQSALTQGILQGDPIDKMAKRLLTVEKMTSGQAVRTARTMTTSAENGGRMASYHDAEEMGIEMMKTWVATLDDRTRDAHAELDGVTIPVEEPFRNSIGDIMFPADPDADGENVYNCRCTLIASIKNVPRNMAIRQRK
jgi:SPP1 gp7 family putative phage head morphogenesis protein